jgi:hypothetical protein
MAEESRRYFSHDAFLLCHLNDSTPMYHPVYAEDTPAGSSQPIPVKTDPQSVTRLSIDPS